MSLLFLIIIVCLVIFMAIKLVDTITSKLAPPITTPSTALHQINIALAINNGDEIWEVGCGDARVLSYCAKLHPDSKFIGIDNGILMLIRAVWRTRRQSNVSIKYGNLKSTKLDTATAIYLYLLPEALSIVKTKIPQGCRVISLEFRLPSEKPKNTIRLSKPAKFAHRLYCYQF